jgi:hypothetical protein
VHLVTAAIRDGKRNVTLPLLSHDMRLSAHSALMESYACVGRLDMIDANKLMCDQSRGGMTPNWPSEIRPRIDNIVKVAIALMQSKKSLHVMSASHVIPARMNNGTDT